ncbi:MAG: chemotaxis protein [Actinomyces sp.]|uniref:chemotaxis protein n=1 Tax=Actinomyces sp. TaxID=29317 RepID=UPI0026DA971B|nr:chemotaxis protein [Actinomyces sp.]MDO4244006.1 chemotaxis protein [Actinomyces sp.]
MTNTDLPHGNPPTSGAAAPPSVRGTEVEHTYAPEELFFSTTDSHGRIRRANSIFMRLSGYPRGALVGRAHNVVRHPDMPAGLFRSMWEDIEAGGAASAYISNRSSDGGTYRVFATIVPSGDGYLSVRTLPMLTDLREDVEGAYARVRQVEAASLAAGSTRREAAAAGQAALLEELRALGYKGTVDFSRQTLAAEVAALVGSGVNIPERRGDDPVARILAEMNGIEDSTAGLVDLLDECARLVTLLGRRAEDIDALSARLGSLRENLRQVLRDVTTRGQGPEVDEVAENYARVDALVLECVEQLHPLAGQVEELRGDVDAVRFAIALLRLHNLAAGFFALQLLEGDDELGENDAVGSLEELVGVLHEGAASLADALALLEARSELVGGELDVVAGSLTATHRPLLELIGAAADAGAAQEVSVRTASALVRDGFPEARGLADLAGAVRDLELPYDPADIDTRLAAVRAVLAGLAGRAGTAGTAGSAGSSAPSQGR